MSGEAAKKKPGRVFTWEEWQAGRAERRRLGNLVALPIIRRQSSADDARLRAAFDGERGPPFGKAWDAELEALEGGGRGRKLAIDGGCDPPTLADLSQQTHP